MSPLTLGITVPEYYWLTAWTGRLCALTISPGSCTTLTSSFSLQQHSDETTTEVQNFAPDKMQRIID